MQSAHTWRFVVLLGLGLAVAGCRFSSSPPSPPEPEDAGTQALPDTGPMAEIDAGTDVADAAVAVDAGPHDTGPPPEDAGTARPDAAPHDAGSAASTPGCGRPAPTQGEWSLTHEGRNRTFLVHVPDGYDPALPTPVVLDLHGRVFTAEAQRDLTSMDEVADREGFIVVHPQGIGRTWNGGVCCGEAMREDIDDVGFLSAVLDALEADLCVDCARVFATGMSNGAYMAHRLACELSDRIAAIAPVAGTMAIANCSPTRPVPVLHFHDDDDQVVRYDGVGGFLSAPGSCEGWAERNGCNATSTPTFMQDDVRCEAWTDCDEGAVVELCTIEGGGHTWPGGTPLPLLGRTTQTISASELAWEFFEMHPFPGR